MGWHANTRRPIVGTVAASMLAAVALLGAVSGCSGDDTDAATPGDQVWAEGAPSVCEAVAPMGADPVLDSAAALDLDTVPPSDLDHLAQTLSELATHARALAQGLRQLEPRPPGADEALTALDRDAGALDAAAGRGDDAAGSVFAAARLRETVNAMASRLDLPACGDRAGLPPRSTTPPAAPLAMTLVCVNDARALARTRPGSSSGDVASAATVDCSQPHQFERYLQFDSSGGPATPFPGDVMLADHAAGQCAETFVEYTGRQTASWSLSYVALPPDAAAWSDGERTISCLAFDPDRETTTGPMARPGG